MKFLDYEKIIRDNYPLLINSYVEQYGEEYREHISSVLARAKYCVFVTPSNICEYVKRKSSEDYMKAILDSYIELGLDISGVVIEEESLEFEDSKIGSLTMALFPDLTNLENFKKKGLFSFDIRYDSLDVDDPIIMERMILLEKLNMKDKSISYQDYYNSYKYQADCLFFRQFLKVVNRNIDKWVQNYDELLDYADMIDQKTLSVGRSLEKAFLISIKEYLSDRDKKLIASGNFELEDLETYGIYFDLDLVKEDYCFSDGPIDFFLDSYTDDLLSDEVAIKQKELIVKMRLKYLEKKGFDIKTLENDELFCDWYLIDSLKEYLPDKEMLNDINDVKNLYYNQFEYECSKICIINGYDLHLGDVEIDTIIDEDGHSCSIFYRDGVIDTDNFSCVICLNPFMDTYNLFDIAIDHELRHAVEMRMKYVNGKIILKTGCDISTFNSELEDGVSQFTDINERITHKLSVEATNRRWERGEFIFSDKYAMITKYPISIYDYDFDNLAIIFEPFRKKIIEAQISPDFHKMYEVIPRRYLKKINTLITGEDVNSVRKLKAIRRKLLQRELENKKVTAKVKKIGAKDE